MTLIMLQSAVSLDSDFYSDSGTISKSLSSSGCHYHHFYHRYYFQFEGVITK